MQKRYFRDILLGLRRSLSATLISIIGLSVGIAVFLILISYIGAELAVNKSFPDYNNTYRLAAGDGTKWQGTPARLGEILSDNMPEVLSFTRVDNGGTNHVVKIDNVPVRTGSLLYVDSTFFSIFKLPFKYGDPRDCLVDKYSLVITESQSKKLFGDESPVGRTVLLDNKFHARITAVIYDPGYSTNISGDMFISFHSMPDIRNWPDLYDCFDCFNYQTFLLVDKNHDRTELSLKINSILKGYGEDFSIESLKRARFTLVDMWDVYFGPETRPEFRKGNLQQVRVLGFMAFLILAVALINYINLATAWSGTRLRQLTLKKIMGASRQSLVAIITGEGILIALISLIGGVLIFGLLRPIFNSVFMVELEPVYFQSAWHIALLLLSTCLLGMISGLYPALSITSSGKISSLSSEISGNKLSSGRLRKTLTALQVFVSIVLIGCTLVIYRQLKFIDRHELGFDKDILVYMPMNKEIRDRDDIFRDELINHPGIDNVSYSYASYRTNNERWGFEFNNEAIQLHMELVDEYYLNTLGLELISGRDFRGRQDSATIIVNQEACRQYFGDFPEGTFLEGHKGMEIIGVVKDFRFQTFDHKVEPLGILYRPGRLTLCNVRLSGRDLPGALDHMEKTWNSYCLGYPFEYHFVDQLYEQRYHKYRSVGQLLIFFSLISVLIASLGIYGLASFTVTRRSREIGIRKVNGASIGDVLMILASDINKIVLWAIIPSLLVIYLAMDRWLNSFAYHTSMPWWIFPAAITGVWITATLSTIGRTLKTAKVNPAVVLRTE